MSSDPIAFVFGDRPARPHKPNRNVEHILGDILSTQGLVALGVVLQALCAALVPAPYAALPAAAFVLAAALPALRRALRPAPEHATRVVGKAAAFLHFADTTHAGKPPGAPAGCHSPLGALQPEFVAMGAVFNGMIAELRAAPPEDDVGFLNAEFYMHAAAPNNNSNMACLYFRSYAHIVRFAHRDGGAHWPAWARFRTLQRAHARLGTQIGIWHEIYEIANAEAVYHNMPRMGLGDMWDAVRAPGPRGAVVYRNALVRPGSAYATIEGRMGYAASAKAEPHDADTDAKDARGTDALK